MHLTKKNILCLFSFIISIIGNNILAQESTGLSLDLRPFSADYILTKKNVAIAKLNLSLEQQDDNWLYTSKAKAVGMAAVFKNDKVHESVIFTIEDSQIKPLEYNYKRLGKKKRKELKVVFDWPSITAKITESSAQAIQTFTLPITENTLDRLSVQVSIMRDLRNNFSEKQYSILDGMENKTFIFNKQIIEELELTAGTYQTYKVSRQHGSRETISWHAARLGYLPIKVERYKKEKLKSTMELNSFEWR